MPERAAFASEPRDGIGRATPRPMNDMYDSVKIADGISCAVMMMMTDRQFGRMCLRIMRADEAPMDLAASTYSFCLIVRISPRTSLAMPTQYSRPNTMNMETMFVPSLPITGSEEKSAVSLNTTDSRIMIRISGSE